MSLGSTSSAVSITQSLSQHALNEVNTISENSLKPTADYNSLNIVEESDQAQLLETLQTIVSLDTSSLTQTTSVSQHINSELLQVTSPLSQISLPNLSSQSSLLPFPASTSNGAISTWLNNKILLKTPESINSSGILPPVTELHPALRSANDLTLLGLSQTPTIPPCLTGIRPSSNLKAPISTAQTEFNNANNEIGSLPAISVAKVKLPNVKRPSLPQSFALNPLSTLPLTNNAQHFELLSNNLVTSQLMEQDNILNSLSSTLSVTNLLPNNLINNAQSSNTLMKALGINGQDEHIPVMTNPCNGNIFENLNTQPLSASITDTQLQNKNVSSTPLSQVNHSFFGDLGNQTLTLSATTLMSSSDASAGQLENLASSSLLADCSDESVFSSFVEETRCFKCKFCTYISLSKYLVISHIKVSHNKNTEAMYSLNSSNSNSVKAEETTKRLRGSSLQSNTLDGRQTINYDSDVTVMPSRLSNTVIQNDTLASVSEEANNRFLCGKCRKGFSSLEACRHHMVIDHNVKSKRVRLERVSDPKTSINRTNNISGNILSTTKSGRTLLELLNSPTAAQLAAKTNQKSKLKDGRNEPEIKLVITVKKQKGEITSRQKAWKKKLKREQGSYICEFKGCNVRFRQLSNLEYHRKCHVNGCSNFVCPECGARLEHWGPLSGHLWRHHALDLELYACDQCSFRTYSLSKLENLHKRIHQDERPYLCDTCGKGFKTSKQLLNHKAIHLEKRQRGQFRSGECPICYRRFSDKRMLRIHLDTVHNKIRPFLCNYCGYTASCKSTLKMHMRQHTGEKPFSCDMCDYRTADHNSLRRHKMRHSGEKPYKCPYCSYACIQSSTYKTHLKNKHPGQDDGLMFSCAHCSFRTIKHDTYITHMAGHKIQTISASSDSATIAIGLQTANTHSNSHRNNVVPLVEAMNIGMGNTVDDNVSASQFMFKTLEDIQDKTVQEVLS